MQKALAAAGFTEPKKEFESAEGKAFLKSLVLKAIMKVLATVCWDIQMEKSQKPCLEKRITFTA